MLGLGLDIFKVKAPVGFSFSDSDAEAYYDALVTANGGDIDSETIYSISLDTFKAAINNHFVQLKADGVYSKLNLYLMYLGGTAATHAIDAISATSVATFVGSPVHNFNGVVLNGTTQYINSNYTLNDFAAPKDSNHLMQYNVDNSAAVDFGVVDGTPRIFLNTTTVNLTVDNISAGGARIFTSATVVNGLMLTVRNSTTDHQAYVNAINSGVTATADVSPIAVSSTQDIYFGARNNNGSPINYLNGTVQFSSTGTKLNDTEVTNWNTAINTLNITLGRDYTFTDSDAEAYWEALTVANGSPIDCPTVYGVSNATVMEAIDDFYVTTKADSTFGQINKLYLTIGGTAATHAINAVNAASELTFVGSPTHGASGVTCNGTTQYIDVGDTPNNFITLNDGHYGMFTSGITTSTLYWGLGANESTAIQSFGSGFPSSAFITWRFTSNSASRNISNYDMTPADTTFNQVLIHSATSNTRRDFYIDGTSVANRTNADVGTISTTYDFYFMAYNNAGTPVGYTNGTFKAGFAGNGLSSTQAATLTTALKNLNTTLGR